MFYFESSISVSTIIYRVLQICELGKVFPVKQANKQTGLVTCRCTRCASSRTTGISTSLSLQGIWLNEKLRKNDVTPICHVFEVCTFAIHFRDLFPLSTCRKISPRRIIFFTLKFQIRKIPKFKFIPRDS